MYCFSCKRCGSMPMCLWVYAPVCKAANRPGYCGKTSVFATLTCHVSRSNKFTCNVGKKPLVLNSHAFAMSGPRRVNIFYIILKWLPRQGTREDSRDFCRAWTFEYIRFYWQLGRIPFKRSTTSEYSSLQNTIQTNECNIIEYNVMRHKRGCNERN